MSNRKNESCQHLFEEGICVYCGTEYAPSAEPLTPRRFYLRFIHRQPKARHWTESGLITKFAAAALITGPLALLASQAPASAKLPLIPSDGQQPQRQYADSDHPARTRSKIINNSDGEITIKFSGCRENEKHHISCQFEDPNGDSHWVYLAGIKLPN